MERDIYHGYSCWRKDVCGQAEASLWKKGIEVRMLFQWLHDHSAAVPSLNAMEQKHIDDYLAWRFPPFPNCDSQAEIRCNEDSCVRRQK
jgi:hypothetical protein